MQSLFPARPTSDDYSKSCTLEELGATRVKYKVANNSVVAQLAASSPHGGVSDFSSEFLITPEDGSYSGVQGMRFRSAVPGQPAVVAATSFLPDDPTPEGAAPFLALLSASGAVVTPASVVSGALVMFGGGTAPSGWVLCDGTHYNSVADTSFAPLFAAIGILYGGASSADFAVPDLRGRVPVGLGVPAAVATLGLNDGVAAGSRRPHHRHTPHTHPPAAGTTNFLGLPGVGTNEFTAVVGSAADTMSINGVTGSRDGGSGVAADSLDAPAFLVINFIIAK